jgi:hypothetical protein
MSLNQLLATAFKEGAGISLEFALRTPRCRELQDLARRHELLDPEDTGLAEYLGERIADRAARNLPASLRKNLHLWDQGLEGQLKLINDIYEKLNTTDWRKLAKKRQQHSYNSDVRSVLPHASGSWNRGSVMPNCLGTAQMLVGLARAVGARHYLVNTIENWQMATLRAESRFLRKSLDLLESRPTSNREAAAAVRKVRRAYAQTLHNLEDPPMAHHALMVELADGNWWLVDPYMRTVYQLPDGEERTANVAQLDIKRQHVVHIFDPADSSLDRFKTRLRVLHATLLYMLSLINGRYTTKDLELELPLILAFASAYAQCRHTEWGDDLRERLIQVSANPDVSDPELFGDASFAYHWALAPKYEGDLPPDKSKIERLIQRSKHDRVLEQRISWRIIAVFLHRALDITDQMYKDQFIKRHRSYEIASPALMLGVATLNHLSSQIPEVRLGGKLAAMSSSQWILADSLAARAKGDTSEEVYERLMARRLEQYSRLRALVPTLRHLEK